MQLPQYSGTLAAVSQEYPVLGRAMTQHEGTRRGPINFANRPCLIELYADTRKIESAAVMKAVQTGVSEWAIQALFDAAGWRGRLVAYVLPTYSVRNRFVQARIDPLLARVDAYRARAVGGAIGSDDRTRGRKDGGGTGNRTLKKFGKGSILFLGSGTDNDFVEFSADVMIVDEYDRCKLANLALAVDRLRESPHPQYFYISNPTLPNQGIARLYEKESDKRRWYHQCERCGERQPLDWFEQVVMRGDDGHWMLRDTKRNAAGKARPICRRCKGPFERTPDGAVWVSEQPYMAMRGYHMSRLDVLSDSLDSLFDEWIKAQGSPEHIRAFYTSVLGVPYQFEGTKLTRGVLEAASTGAAMDWTGGPEYEKRIVTAGVDVGSFLHVQISIRDVNAEGHSVRETRFIVAATTFEQVSDIFRRYRVNVAVVDAMPETHKAQELRDEFTESGGCDVWLCRFYPTQRVGEQKYGMRLKHRSKEVQVDRTAVFDVSFADILENRRVLPIDALTVPTWGDQMCAPVRVVDSAKQRIVWQEGSAADHFRLADVYDRIAMDLLDAGGSFSVLE